jgi:hypothetical protein
MIGWLGCQDQTLCLSSRKHQLCVALFNCYNFYYLAGLGLLFILYTKTSNMKSGKKKNIYIYIYQNSENEAKYI